MVCRLSFRDTHARFLRLASGALFALALIGAPGDARAEAVAVELILAIDCSSSVQPEEYALQMRGVADAFRSPEVIQAIVSATPNGVAVTLVQCSGGRMQTQALPSTDVHDKESAAGVTINGLAILNDEPNLDKYYKEQVIGGKRSFV